MHPNNSPSALIPLLEGIRRLGLRSRARWYDWANEKSPRFKPDLPRPIRIGVSVFFLESDVEDFIHARVSDSRN